ncbi:transmembrane protein 117-like isoform X2 [Tachypleus tridentatus]|uniref:transmembrane protein 117-like isoform X2 n=1 Tax=Tachypleus tridentatus TaxID=6853 RepID=UPI003FD6927F
MPLLLSPLVSVMCMMEQKESWNYCFSNDTSKSWMTTTNQSYHQMEDESDSDESESWKTSNNLFFPHEEDQTDSEDRESWVTTSNLSLNQRVDQGCLNSFSDSEKIHSWPAATSTILCQSHGLKVLKSCCDSKEIESWIVATNAAIRKMEERCHRRIRGPQLMCSEPPLIETRLSVSCPAKLLIWKDRLKSDPFVEEKFKLKSFVALRTLSDHRQLSATFQTSSDPLPKRGVSNQASFLDDIMYIDDSTRSSVSTGHIDSYTLPPISTPRRLSMIADKVSSSLKLDKSTFSKNERLLFPKNSSQEKNYYDLPEDDTSEVPKSDVQHPLTGPSQWDFDGQSVYSLHMEKDFRYYFQHPYARLFVCYFVIFCNFLIFAEDPVSHSHTESEIPVVGNVFSFVATKYPPEWTWCLVKVVLWLFAIFIGLEFGKHLIHHCLLRNIFRLKMFREEQGSWMIMFLTVIILVYIFSLVYNAFLISSYPSPDPYTITAMMGITNVNFMKAAACGTWLGDFITAWMVTDMMLQDNLYVDWAKPARKFWRSHGQIRIFIFWAGSSIMTALVVTLIVSDWITWDLLNRDFVATSELSRAFLASFILVMDLFIVMQDWDFPHFVCDLDIKLPGMHVASFKYRMFQKYVSISDVVFHITGKWFNYGIIVFVMILDLNMWKNQIFYSPNVYGQYIGPTNKIYTVDDQEVLKTVVNKSEREGHATHDITTDYILLTGY